MICNLISYNYYTNNFCNTRYFYTNIIPVFFVTSDIDVGRDNQGWSKGNANTKCSLSTLDKSKFPKTLSIFLWMLTDCPL